MSWMVARLWTALLAWALGAGVGFFVGSIWGAPVFVALAGGLLGIGLVWAVDAIRGQRLLRWLRSAQQGVAPRDTGFWGEIGYRTEKALRLRERAVEAERRRLEQFLSAIEASPNGVMMLDADEHIDWLNTAAAAHFGLNPERDRGQRVTNLVRSPAFKAYLTAGNYSEPVTFVAPRGDATLSVVVSPHGGGHKLVLSRDVTERERAEVMRREFVANVSHEIRTPLTVLSGFVETLENITLDDAERNRALARMRQQTERMQVLVDDLLILAQLEGSPRPEPDRWVSVAALMRQAEADVRALSGGRHTIEFAGAEGLELAGAEGELASAIGNLLTNAVRYTPEQGRISVRWSVRADGAAQLEVADNGIGIPPEHLPRLTERFHRVDGSRSRETGGTGLGLSIVKHVMQRHGGDIDIASEIGRGSSFKLVFPAARLRRAAATLSGTDAARST